MNGLMINHTALITCQRPVDQLNIDGALRALLNRDFQHAIECIQDIRI